MIMLVSLLEFLLVISIPFVGGAFLYCELRWNKFYEKSVGYGCLYALLVSSFLFVNHEIRALGKLVDNLVLGDHQTLQYIAPYQLKDEAMFLDCLELKKNGAKILEAKEEGRWCVINYRADKKLLSKSSGLQKLLEIRETPVLRRAR